MNVLKALAPVLILLSACKKEDDEPEACTANQVSVAVTVNDTDGEPVDANVDIDGEPCDGGNGSYTCTAIIGENNQVTATLFPSLQPAAQRVSSEGLAGADCENLSMELRMLPAQK